MGRRSRKRLSTDPLDASERQERLAAVLEQPRADWPESPAGPTPRRRPRLQEAPKAPWSPFPLVELCILLALVFIVVGFLSAGSRGRVLLAGGLTLVTLSALELSVREHFAGYRSHSALLGGAAAVALDAALFFLTGLPQELLLGLGLLTFAGVWHLMRDVFRRRTGGMGFRG